MFRNALIDTQPSQGTSPPRTFPVRVTYRDSSSSNQFYIVATHLHTSNQYCSRIIPAARSSPFVVCRREAASRCLTVRLQLPPPASTPRTGASRDHGLGSAQASPVKDTNRPDLFPSTRITPYNPRRAPILHSLYLFTPYLTRCPGFSASFSRSHLPGLTRPRRASGSPGTRCHIWTHHPRFSSLFACPSLLLPSCSRGTMP